LEFVTEHGDRRCVPLVLTKHAGLRVRDAEAIDLFDVLPISAEDAVVAGRSLMDVHLPGPGPGSLRKLAALPTDHRFSHHVVVMASARLNGGYAVLQVDNRPSASTSRGPGPR
jgi:hypothetical protein